MQLVNRTKFPDYALRRIVAFCRRHVGLKTSRSGRVKWPWLVTFRTRRGGVTGRAYWNGSMEVSIAREDGAKGGFPHDFGRGPMEIPIADRLAGVVMVTAHELQHLKNFADGSHKELVKARDSEPHCDRIGKRVMLAFEADRERLTAEWFAEPARRAAARMMPPDPHKAHAKEYAASLARLTEWKAKLKAATRATKTARTKVRKLKAKIYRLAKLMPKPADPIAPAE